MKVMTRMVGGVSALRNGPVWDLLIGSTSGYMAQRGGLEQMQVLSNSPDLDPEMTPHAPQTCSCPPPCFSLLQRQQENLVLSHASPTDHGRLSDLSDCYSPSQ